MKLRLAMMGFGNVGQAFARLLTSRKEWLRAARRLDVEVIAIATRTKGSLSSDGALDLERALRELGEEGTLKGYGPEWTDLSPLEILESCDADLMVELTPLNIDSGQPAIDHIRKAFGRGMHVVTANKGPPAHAYDELRSLASSRGVQFRFEGTVMDGTPIFSLVERTLPGCEVIGIAGVLNSTTNYILTEMSRGRSIEEALEEARRIGVAEADPSLDIEGWDAAAKITVLANVLMGAKSNPKKVDRTGIRNIDGDLLRMASESEKRIRLVARAEKVEGEVRTSVRPELVGPNSPFWPVTGTSSALTLKTDLMGDVTIIEHDPSVKQTAYAIFSDMLLISGTL